MESHRLLIQESQNPKAWVIPLAEPGKYSHSLLPTHPTCIHRQEQARPVCEQGGAAIHTLTGPEMSCCFLLIFFLDEAPNSRSQNRYCPLLRKLHEPLGKGLD